MATARGRRDRRPAQYGTTRSAESAAAARPRCAGYSSRVSRRDVSSIEHAPDAPVRVGISSCLLGREVRYDGGHKRDPFLVETFGRFVEWVPVCPEVELGLGIPREPIRLERKGEEIRLVAPKSGADHTQAMRRFAERRVAALRELDLCGFVLKQSSPSCGMERVKVHAAAGGPARRDGRGAFAAVLMRELPLLPVEEEGRLCDPRLREGFVTRALAHRRLQASITGRFTTGALVAFHAAHELLLLAHAPEAHRALGRLVAAAKQMPRAELRERYARGFMAALAHRATPRKHVNVLRHVLGHLDETLDAASRAELAQAIEGYGRGLVPRIVPLTLLRHHVRRAGVPWLDGQVYLAPHPMEPMLLNHA